MNGSNFDEHGPMSGCCGCPFLGEPERRRLRETDGEAD
jgi:hypothetical protein